MVEPGEEEEEEQALMPRIPRRFITIKKKIEIAEHAVQALQDQSMSLKGLAREHSMQPGQLRRWISSLPSMKRLAEEKKQGKWTMHSGRQSNFSRGNELCEWVLSLRNDGMPVSMNLVILRAAQMDTDFRRKKQQTKYSIVRRLLRSRNIVIRAKTHEAQRPPKEMEDEGKAFITRVRPTLAAPNRDPKYILNMDQTPVFFSMTPNTTLNIRGKRNINVRSSSGSTMRLTCAITVTASGDILQPLIIFKGTRNGRISREFSSSDGGFPPNCSYACQERAWMDEIEMLQWVDEVITPWASTVPSGIVPYLLLDSYRCHMMSSVVERIQDLGIEVEHIPGGCTGLVQPVDVGINKPFKNRCRRRWEEYMLEEGLLQNKTQPPTRQLMALWCTESLRDTTVDIVKNAWRHAEYSYFPQEQIVEEEETEESNNTNNNNNSSSSDGDDDELDEMFEILNLSTHATRSV
jgi:hypothetical protein